MDNGAMGRLIVLVVLIVVAVWLVRRALKPPTTRGSDSPNDAEAARLVRCAHCGVYLPDAEAAHAGDIAYCTEDHARLGPRRR